MNTTTYNTLRVFFKVLSRLMLGTLIVGVPLIIIGLLYVIIGLMIVGGVV